MTILLEREIVYGKDHIIFLRASFNAEDNRTPGAI